MRYSVMIELVVEADGTGQERSVEKSIAGVLDMVVAEDEAPHQIVGYSVRKVELKPKPRT